MNHKYATGNANDEALLAIEESSCILLASALLLSFTLLRTDSRSVTLSFPPCCCLTKGLLGSMFLFYISITHRRGVGDNGGGFRRHRAACDNLIVGIG